MSLESSPTECVLDVEGTLARFGGDRQLFSEIITFFLEDAPPLLRELRRAADSSDAMAVRSTAHALKGLVAGCGGVRAAQSAQRVENAGHAGDLKAVDALLEALNSEVEFLRQAAVGWRK